MPVRNLRLGALCIVLALGCSQSAPPLRLLPNETVVGQMVRDLDADGRQDTAVFLRDTTTVEPSVYTRLHVRLSSGQSVSWTGDWGLAPKAVREASGGADSSLVTVRSDSTGSEIVQYGAEYGCCSPALRVSRVSRAGLATQLEFPEFEVLAVESDDAGIGALTGAPCLQQFVGEAATYQPRIVIRLSAPFGIDSAASETRTRQVAGDFGGLACREDIEVITRNGRPELRRKAQGAPQ